MASRCKGCERADSLHGGGGKVKTLNPHTRATSPPLPHPTLPPLPCAPCSAPPRASQPAPAAASPPGWPDRLRAAPRPPGRGRAGGRCVGVPTCLRSHFTSHLHAALRQPGGRGRGGGSSVEAAAVHRPGRHTISTTLPYHHSPVVRAYGWGALWFTAPGRHTISFSRGTLYPLSP